MTRVREGSKGVLFRAIFSGGRGRSLAVALAPGLRKYEQEQIFHVRLRESGRDLRRRVTHFHEEGEGTPPPPCDAYLIRRSYWLAGRWDDIEWYVKIGVTYRATPAEDELWVESCHESW